VNDKQTERMPCVRAGNGILTWTSQLFLGVLQYMSRSRKSQQESPRRRQQAGPEVTEAVLREERKNPAIKAELIGAFEGKPSNGTSV
jgi:hypothetical protein